MIARAVGLLVNSAEAAADDERTRLAERPVRTRLRADMAAVLKPRTGIRGIRKGGQVARKCDASFVGALLFVS